MVRSAPGTRTQRAPFGASTQSLRPLKNTTYLVEDQPGKVKEARGLG